MADWIALDRQPPVPPFALGQWRDVEGTNLFLYASIERLGFAECRGIWPVTEKRLALCWWRSHDLP